MPTRSWSDASRAYRYGFNDQEKDIEIAGESNSLDFGERMYNPYVGRFLSMDKLAGSYPFWSPYSFGGNTPIQAIDLDGLEIYYSQSGQKIGTYGTSTEIRVINDDQLAAATTEFAIYNTALKTDPAATNTYLATTLLNNGSVSYNDYFTNVSDVTGGDALETYGNNGSNCNAAAVKQLADDGVTQTGPANAFQIKVNNTLQSTAHSEQTSSPPAATGNTPSNLTASDPIGASIYTMTQLKKGKPVMVGLEEKNSAGSTIGVPSGNHYNYNALTGHFVVINSATVDANGNVSFGYMDNASAKCGTDPGNQLSLDMTTGSMSDNSSPCTGGVSAYEVTEIRKNK